MPILLYHRVGNISECGDNLPVEKFEDHIRMLRENNIDIVKLSDYLEDPSLRKKAVAISFDDGMRNIYQNVYPLSLQYGFNFIVFLNSRFIGKSNWHSKKSRMFYSSKELAPVEEKEGLWFFEYLTGDEISEMKSNGILFGAHGRGHRILTELNRSELKEEIFQCKKDLEDILEKEILYFSYPWGTFNRAVKREVGRSGFKFAFASNMSRRQNRFSIGRLLVRREWEGKELLVEIKKIFGNESLLTFSSAHEIIKHIIKS